MTESNNLGQKNENSNPLTEKDILAMDLKFKGKSLKEISEIIGISYGTVRGWFMTGGRLFKAYKNYSKREAEFIREESRSLFKSHLKASVRVLIDLLKDEDPRIRLQVAKEIITRELGEPRKVVIDKDDYNPAREILLGAGLLEAEEDQEDFYDIGR